MAKTSYHETSSLPCGDENEFSGVIAQAIEDVATSCFDYDYAHAHEQSGDRMYFQNSTSGSTKYFRAMPVAADAYGRYDGAHAIPTIGEYDMRLPLFCLFVLMMSGLPGAKAFAAADAGSVFALFRNPPREYASAPLWVWNDLLTEEEVAYSLNALADQGVRQAFVHPRPGLMTPYLSDDWFRMWRAALDVAEKRDMNIWIYDENSYPSGFAGGFVPEAMPEARCMGLVLQPIKNLGALKNVDVLAVFERDGEQWKNVTEAFRANPSLTGDYLAATLSKGGESPWFGGKFYVDLLRPGVTEKFLEITLDPYRKAFPGEWGKRIPGSFTDEPHLASAKGLHWTPDLPREFERRRGYSLMDNLPGLTEATGDWKRVRHDYYQTLLDLFGERWGKPYRDYCARAGIEFTGHYWEHEWPNTRSVPDNMAMSAWQQRPGIDILFNQYGEGVHAQFGNVRAVMELQSVANQMGCARTLCETYGGSGWDIRFEDLKRIGDWVQVLGVNTINEHLSHITLRGARKRDYPVTFSYHEPWWKAYHVIANYFARVSAALSHGEQRNPALVLEPTTTAWMYQGAQGDTLGTIGNTFQQLVTDLAKAQAEFDIGCEDIIARHGASDGAQYVVGQRAYDTFVLPPHTENLNARTAELLEAFIENGGVALACEPAVLARIDGQASPRAEALLAQCRRIETAQLATALRERVKDGFAVVRPEGDGGILYHHRRRLDDGDLVFFVNTSNESPAHAVVRSRAKGVQQWDPDTGECRPYPFGGDGVEVDLPPCGSLLLFFSDQSIEAAAPAKAKRDPRPAPPTTAMDIRRVCPNVLTLDFATVTAGGETRENMHVRRAGRFAFQKNGLERNPWDHAVQFKDEFLAMTFPAESGFKAEYAFVVEGTPPGTLHAVIERADLYRVACNGKPVVVDPAQWWLDKSFVKVDISGAVRTGENRLTIEASPFSVFHEIEAVYLLGDFGLKAADKGFVLVPPQPLQPGPWNAQGCPLYGDAVSYSASFDLTASETWTVSLPKWYGSVAEVTVNGKSAGYIYRQPFRLDVSGLIVEGSNTVEVVVYGTLKNTMGPHHGNPPLGIAAPDMFDRVEDPGPPPGAQYSSVGYGLFEPFVVSAG